MVKVLSLRFQQYFGLFTMSPFEGSSETVLFRHLSHNVLPNLYILKYISSQGDLLFQTVVNLIWISKKQKKVQKFFFDY